MFYQLPINSENTSKTLVFTVFRRIFKSWHPCCNAAGRSHLYKEGLVAWISFIHMIKTTGDLFLLSFDFMGHMAFFKNPRDPGYNRPVTHHPKDENPQEITVKKLIIASLTALFPMLATTGIQAGTLKLVTEDNSTLSKLCIAAVNTEGPVFALAKDMGIHTADISKIACNGQPLMEFVRVHPKLMYEDSIANYSFNEGDSSIETQLCIAAVSEPEKYEALKPQYLSTTGKYVEKLLCNSQPLDSFVKRYSRQDLSAL